jgi:hypothetical protein
MNARQASRNNVSKSTPRERVRSTDTTERARLPADDDLDDDDDEATGASSDADTLDDPNPEILVAANDKSSIKEDPTLDRRIIEGMLNDRKTLLDDLQKEGMTQGAVLRRAAELGLSEALLRQVKGVAADLAGERPGRRPMPSSLGARTCLSCDRVFLSTGPGNRLCMRCRGGDAGLAQF